MSYILSALKKADQNRQCPPPAQSSDVAKTFADYEHEDKAVSPFKLQLATVVPGVIGVCIVAVLFFGYTGKDMDKEYTAVSEPSVSVSSTPEQTSLESEFTETRPSETMLLENKPVGLSHRAGTIQATNDAGTASVAAEIIHEPPHPQTGNASPAKLNITGYIYFENRPELSKVFIDGKVYRHGDQLPEGGVVHNFSQNQFEVSRDGLSFWYAVQ